MRYLIQPLNSDPFLTNWFNVENNYDEGMIVYDLEFKKYTINGDDWFDIEIDHL